MDRSLQHRKNATIERLFMSEAANDERYLGDQSRELRGRGQVARANFMHHEAVIAGSFKDKRRQILNREIRLSKR
jgi:hypothetical protein